MGKIASKMMFYPLVKYTSVYKKIRFNLAYFRPPPWDTRVSPPELVAFVETNPPGTALDLGCGTGTNAIYLAHHDWQVTGIDFAWRAIQIARKRVRQLNLEMDLRVGDVTRLGYLLGPYDLILDIGCLHNLDYRSRQAYLDQIKRLLAPRGTYLVYLILREKPDDPGRGMLISHLEEITKRFKVYQRVDSTHKGNRLSAWFTFHMLS